ncbi:hypothetical protein G3I40_20085 [Streptomyces sp. SID14478]|nr:hypothetical protein [Streptomyces sp. SID14478]
MGRQGDGVLLGWRHRMPRTALVGLLWFAVAGPVLAWPRTRSAPTAGARRVVFFGDGYPLHHETLPAAADAAHNRRILAVLRYLEA